EGGHGVFDAVLGEGDDVHVAFYHDRLVRLADGAAGGEQVVQLRALVEQGGLGGVEVLRLAAGDDAPSEAHGAAAVVADGEHHPASEAVVVPPLVAADDQAGVLERGQVGADAEGPDQAVPLVRGEGPFEAGGGL